MDEAAVFSGELKKKARGKGCVTSTLNGPVHNLQKSQCHLSSGGVSFFSLFLILYHQVNCVFHQLNVLRCYSGTPTPPLPNLQRVDVEGQLEKAVLQAVRGIRFVSIVFSTITF